MPANTTPIFPLTPRCSWGTVLTADATATKNHDGTAAGIVTLFTAGAYGSKIDQIKVRALGSNIATALRIFINNGSANTTAANNTLIYEKTIAATTISEVAELVDYDLTLTNGSFDVKSIIPYLPATYKIMAIVGTTVAAGLHCSVWGSDF